jgi:uncharacterized membrane protein YoaK (UPF0700 family)
VYASFMTGNTTSGGLHAAQGKLQLAGHSLLPIPFFLLGVLGGTLIKQVDNQGDKPRALARVSVSVGVLLVLEVVTAYLGCPEWLSIVLLGLAMGALNTSVTRVGGQTVSLGYMTGDLNNLAQHLANGIRHAPVEKAQTARDTHWSRAALLATLWIAFFAGAVLGGASALHFAFWTLLLPAFLLLALAAAEFGSDSATKL